MQGGAGDMHGRVGAVGIEVMEMDLRRMIYD